MLILSLFFYCGPKQEKVEKYMEDSVEVVVNHIEPYKIKGEPSTFTLEEELTIDTEKDDIAETGLTDIWSFDVDSEGYIYLLNRRSNENFIFKFDREGNFVTSFGYKGQGPGELENSMYLRVIPLDEIITVDPHRKLVVFNQDGSFKEQIEFQVLYIEALPLENGNFLVKKRIRYPNSKYQEWSLVLLNTELEEIKELDRYKRPNFTIGEELVYPLHGSVHCISGVQIYVGNTEKGYEIWVYDFEGNLKRKIKKDYRPVEVPEEMKKEIMKQFGDPRAADLRYSFRKHCLPFQYFFTDDEGHLFVMTYEKSEILGEYMYDVFNADGLFISRISLGNANFLMQWNIKFATAKNKRLYCLKEKENGYKELVAYKMRWEK